MNVQELHDLTARLIAQNMGMLPVGTVELEECFEIQDVRFMVNEESTVIAIGLKTKWMIDCVKGGSAL